MKNIFLFEEKIEDVIDFLQFNNISYQTGSLWHQDNYHDLTLLPSNCCLIMTVLNLLEVYRDCDDSRQCLQQFLLNDSNCIVLYDDYDNPVKVAHQRATMLEIDSMCSYAGQITCVIDGEITEPDFPNIEIVHRQSAFILRLMPRLQFGEIKKQNCERDFLLTMGKQVLHRDRLWDQLTQRGLLSRAHAKYHRGKHYDEWLGKSNPLSQVREVHHWQVYELHPSPDLYSNTWFEIVPECTFEKFIYITEKTVKPISTKTPFLIVSNPGYLKHLHKIGFRTFGDYIDESYDDIIDLDQRIKSVLDQVQRILDRGSEQFYHETKSVLDHNHKYLCMLHGMSRQLNDQVLTRVLKSKHAID